MRVLLLLILFISTDSFSSWKYHKTKDKLTDRVSSYVSVSKRGYNISFNCKAGFIDFNVDTGSFINLKSNNFKLFYRVDKSLPKKVIMRTYSNSYVSGYTYDALQIAKDFIHGNKVIIRVRTHDNGSLEAEFKLSKYKKNIIKLLNDCEATL